MRLCYGAPVPQVPEARAACEPGAVDSTGVTRRANDNRGADSRLYSRPGRPRKPASPPLAKRKRGHIAVNAGASGAEGMPKMVHSSVILFSLPFFVLSIKTTAV